MVNNEIIRLIASHLIGTLFEPSDYTEENLAALKECFNAVAEGKELSLPEHIKTALRVKVVTALAAEFREFVAAKMIKQESIDNIVNALLTQWSDTMAAIKDKLDQHYKDSQPKESASPITPLLDSVRLNKRKREDDEPSPQNNKQDKLGRS